MYVHSWVEQNSSPGFSGGGVSVGVGVSTVEGSGFTAGDVGFMLMLLMCHKVLKSLRGIYHEGNETYIFRGVPSPCRVF